MKELSSIICCKNLNIRDVPLNLTKLTQLLTVRLCYEETEEYANKKFGEAVVPRCCEQLKM